MNYDKFLRNPLGRVWKKIGIKKRAGVVFPLFSIYSKNSVGIGEIPDLKLAVEWCHKTGNSILQILPINDSFLSSPFSPQSSIALNPIHLSLSKIAKTADEIRTLKEFKKKYPTNSKKIDYAMGEEKMAICKKIFKRIRLTSKFHSFAKKNQYWLKDYALFKSLKSYHKELSWKYWPEKYRNRNKKALASFQKENSRDILFWQWIQWILFEQLTSVKRYAEKKKILLKGDLPLLVSEDSADCWSKRDYFNLELSSGAPPDGFSKEGQKWGMPPYDWSNIFKDKFSYFSQRLKYAQNFYDIIRIDHVIGLFRIWSIPPSTPKELKGKRGFFVPKKETEQVKLGKNIMKKIINSSQMLPCAEDLGTIPDFCREAIEKAGIPGLDIGRRQKNYRELAVSTLSTHDLNLFPAWLEKHKLKNDKKTVEKNLIEINSSPSIFNILLIFEWLFLGGIIKTSEAADYRINKPGEISSNNWAIKIPISLEELLKNPVNYKIKKILLQTDRFQ